MTMNEKVLKTALDLMLQFDHASLSPEHRQVLDEAETRLALLESDLGGKPRDPELVEYARSIGIAA